MKQWLTFINKPSTQANLVFSFFYFGLISALGWFYSNSLIFTISNQPPINLPTQPPTLKSLNFCLIWLIFLQLTSSMLQSFWSFVMLILTGNSLESNCPGYICQWTFDHATNVHETIVHETIDKVELVQESICDTLKVRGRILETWSKSTRGQKN